MNDIFLDPSGEEEFKRQQAERERMWAQIEKPEAPRACPFCGGAARISAKEHLFGGYNVAGTRARREYIIRVICNKCHARGGTVVTGWVTSLYGNYKRKAAFVPREDAEALAAAERKAVLLWNGRTEVATQ